MYEKLVTLSFFALNQCLFGITKGALAPSNKKEITRELSPQALHPCFQVYTVFLLSRSFSTRFGIDDEAEKVFSSSLKGVAGKDFSEGFAPRPPFSLSFKRLAHSLKHFMFSIWPHIPL